MCTKPSTPGNTSTNAPKLVRRLTVPSRTSPSATCSGTCSHGSGNVCLIDREILPFSASTERTLTLTSCPTFNASAGLFTRS